MADLTVSADVDAMMSSANNAAIISNIGAAAASHTHTVEDLDFAVSTEIGADLADADEILVSDGGGNTTRRKSLVSRIWTYIKAKIDAGLTIAGAQTFSGQVELTGQAASTDDSAMTKGLVRDFSSVWGDVYKLGNGETDTNNKLSTVVSGDRFFNFACYTGTAAGDGQWTTFQSQTFGLTAGSGSKGQLRDSFSYKFKFDSNTTTNTDVDLWLIRGKTANATLPVAGDVCFALKFAGEEDLMIAVYDGVTAHTTTIDVSTINSWFTHLASQQEFMWTWDGTTAKVYGRYRKPAGAGPDNDWSVWYTMGSLTPSGMSAGTTNLSYAGLHFLQHTPVTCTSYTKNYIIWDLKHTSHVIVPN